MTAALSIARVTSRQLLTGRRYVWFGLLAISPAVLYLLVSQRVTDSERFDLFVGVGVILYISIIVPIIVLTFGAGALGQEKRDSTLSFLVLRPLSRTSIAVAKLAGAFAASFLLTGTGAIVLGLAYGLRSGDFGWVIPLFVGTAVAAAAYVAVFVPLGLVTERATLIGLAFVFIWENGVVYAAPGLVTTSPWRLGFAALASLGPEQMDGEILDATLRTLNPSLGASVMRAAIFLLVGGAITTILLRRRDLV